MPASLLHKAFSEPSGDFPMEEPKLTQEGRNGEWALHRDWGEFQAG